MSDKPSGTLLFPVDLDLTQMETKLQAVHKRMVEGATKSEEAFKTLGISSDRMFAAQKQTAFAALEAIKNKEESTLSDRLRAQQAYNAKVNALTEQHYGMANKAVESHESSMASLTRGVLRLYAAYYVLSSGIQVVHTGIMKGVEAIDSMKIAAIGQAAQITTMQGTTGNIVENYRKNLQYATALVPVLEQIDAESYANLQQIQRMNMAMSMQGTILDVNNEKQKESFTALTNAVALFTQGQDKEKQASQEIRALFTAQVKEGNMVAMMIDNMARASGDYKDGLKEIVAKGREHGDTLERLQPYLIGIVAASGDIANTWEATKSTMETTVNQVLREGFKGAYQDIIKSTKELSEWAKQHKAEISEVISGGWWLLKNTINGIVSLLKLGIEYKNELFAIGAGIMAGPMAWIGYAINNVSNIDNQIKKLEGMRTEAEKTGKGLASINYQLEQLYKKREEGKPTDPGNYGAFDANRPVDVPKVRASVDRNAEKEAAKAAKAAETAAKKEQRIWEQGQQEFERIMLEEQSFSEATSMKELESIQLKEDKKLLKIQEMFEERKISAEQYADSFVLITDNTEKRKIEVWEKGQQEYSKIISEEADFAETENERAINKIISQETHKAAEVFKLLTAGKINFDQYYDAIDKFQTNSSKARSDRETKEQKRIADGNYQLINNIKGYETQAYNFKINQINAQAQVYREQKLDEASIAAWVKDQQIKAMIEYGKSGNDVAMGMNAAFAQMYQNQITWGGAAFQVTTQLFTDMKSTIGTVFFDAMKGDLKDFSTYWDSFMNSLLKTFTDILAQMAVNWITSQIFMQQNSAMSGMGFNGAASAQGGMGSLLSTAAMGATGYSMLGGSGISAASIYGEGMLGAYGTDISALAAGGNEFAMAELASMGGAGVNTGFFASMSPYLGPAGLGFTGGSILASLTGGSQLGGGLGGAAGAVLGQMLIPIPVVGALVGGAVGSAVGSFAEDIGSAVGDVFEDIGDWFAKGAAFSGGSIVPFAKGDIFSKPTIFPMAQGNVGLMGEAGPEAIMPLTRGSDGKLGVKAQGGDGGFIINIVSPKFYLDGEEIKGRVEMIADQVIVERNSRGVNPTRRIYN